MKKLLLIFSVALAFFTATPAVLGQVNPKDMVKLQKGEVLVTTEKDAASGDHQTIGKAIFQAQTDVVWKVLTNYEAYPQFLSDVKEASVQKRDGNKVWIQFKFHNVFPFADFKCLMVAEESQAEGVLRLKMEQGDFDKYYASWKFTVLDPAKILAEYKMYRYVGWWWFPFVPNTLSNESMVSDNLTAFRKQVKFVQMQNSSQPEQVIKPIWRKSMFKDKDKSKDHAKPDKEPKPEEKSDK